MPATLGLCPVPGVFVLLILKEGPIFFVGEAEDSSFSRSLSFSGKKLTTSLWYGLTFGKSIFLNLVEFTSHYLPHFDFSSLFGLSLIS